MVYRQILNTTSYAFGDLRELLAKATPPRSGDRLAGIAADSAEQGVTLRRGKSGLAAPTHVLFNGGVFKSELLAQRVIARFHLNALSTKETEHYIRHRLSVAGMTRS